MWPNPFQECEIILYRQYVDTIICLFNCESDADKSFEFLNTQRSNMRRLLKLSIIQKKFLSLKFVDK